MRLFPIIHPKEIGKWLVVAFGISIVMLMIVAITAALLPSFPGTGSNYAITLENPQTELVKSIIIGNSLVLALHFFAAYIGVLVSKSRDKKNLKPVSRFQELPSWVAKGALIYALAATAFSVVLQATSIGFVARETADALSISVPELMISLLPHAVLELTGIFLPLGLFLVQAKRKALENIAPWILTSLVLGFAMIVVAAYIEVFLTRHLILSWFI